MAKVSKKATKKRKPSDCKKCSGKYKLAYNNHNIPVFTCDKCGDVDLTWHTFFSDYLTLFKDKENWDNPKHHVSCIIGFFCYMYEKTYGANYMFVPRNPNPFSAKECRDAWSLLGAFGGDAHQVRKYLYWVFTKAINKNTEIVSFGYVNAPALVRKYVIKSKKKHVLGRESKLPKEFLNWCKSNTPSIFDKVQK
jgi:hypothetical protein